MLWAQARWTAYMPTEELPPRMATRFGVFGVEIVAMVVRAVGGLVGVRLCGDRALKFQFFSWWRREMGRSKERYGRMRITC